MQFSLRAAQHRASLKVSNYGNNNDEFIRHHVQTETENTGVAKLLVPSTDDAVLDLHVPTCISNAASYTVLL
jgi:hypothetical protein